MVKLSTRALFTAANACMLFLFLLGAAVQYNDPDPWRWIAIYFAGAGACAIDLRNWTQRAPIFATVMLVAAVWMIAVGREAWGRTSLPELFEPMEKGGGPIEYGREAAGLGIIAVWMAVLLLRWWHHQRQQTRAG